MTIYLTPGKYFILIFRKRVKLNEIKPGKRRLDGRDHNCLAGFGLIGGSLMRKNVESKEKKNKRDSIVGIGQWGRRKRIFESGLFSKR